MEFSWYIEEGKGLYALLLRLERAQEILIGKLGEFPFPAGMYIYIGSAWGAGGFQARLQRHLSRAGRNPGKMHWHIDYLLPFVYPEGVLLFPRWKCECALAALVAALPGASRFPPGFGASDCGCLGHLVLMR
ncbi:MAG: hypothetical protein DRI61_13315 [Chloroflexi bacterium]|nr:MAG: hypothetical protein DRI61_13315 [Chloroflexota bacterium]